LGITWYFKSLKKIIAKTLKTTTRYPNLKPVIREGETAKLEMYAASPKNRAVSTSENG
jgi:hypothetical protein